MDFLFRHNFVDFTEVMKGMEQFQEFKQRLSVLDDGIRKAALKHAREIYFKNRCSKEEALEKGIARAELEERNL